MMLKKRSNGWVRLRMLLAVPVAAGVVYAFAQPEMSEKTSVVANGTYDTGCTASGLDCRKQTDRRDCFDETIL